MRAAPHERGGRPGQIAYALQVAERAHEQDDGLLARLFCVRGRRPPVGVHALIVHAQALRISTRAQRNIRQVTRHRQQTVRTLKRPRAVMRVPRSPRAPPEPRVGIPAMQRHHERRARLPRGAHRRQRPGRLVLVNDVRAPRGDRAAHPAQASCLRGHTKRERAAERARGSLNDGDRHRRVTDARRQRESPPLQLRHRERVREREVGRGNQQGPLRQSDPHEGHPETGAERGAGMPPS